jgi:hypothetical protein
MKSMNYNLDKCTQFHKMHIDPKVTLYKQIFKI